MCLSLSLSPCGFSSPSTERCERRASLASLALVDELTGATSSGSCPALTSICWPWSTCSANSKESSPRPSMRPTSWGSARNRRARTGREAVEMAGVVLGYRASWHDRGPGGRHDDGARSRGRGHPHPVTTRTSLYSQSLLYYIGVLRGSLSHCDRSSPPSPDWCGDVRRLRRDSYGLHWFLIRPQSADTDPPSPIVGLRCGFGLRLRAPSLFFSLACRRVPFSLRRLPLGFR